MINYKILGNNIREMRENLNLSQNDLASSADISIRRLSQIENGNVENLSLNTIASISELLKCDITTLIGNTTPDEISSISESNFKNIIDCSNYIYRNPFRKISTFCQLFLILPLINPSDLFDALSRVNGHIFGNEDYIAQAIGYAYRNIPESKAKEYVETLLNLIEAAPWKDNPDNSPSDILADIINESFKDSDFQQKLEAYEKTIKDKLKLYDNLNRFIDTLNTLNNQ